MGRSQVEWLLEDLCVRFGYCIPAEARARLVQEPPETVEAFVHALVDAEGEDLGSVDKRMLAQMKECVRKHVPGIGDAGARL